MSDLTAIEKRKLEHLFGMASGYVLNFTNRTFEEFVLESTGRAIYDGTTSEGVEGQSIARLLERGEQSRCLANCLAI